MVELALTLDRPGAAETLDRVFALLAEIGRASQEAREANGESFAGTAPSARDGTGHRQHQVDSDLTSKHVQQAARRE